MEEEVEEEATHGGARHFAGPKPLTPKVSLPGYVYRQALCSGLPAEEFFGKDGGESQGPDFVHPLCHRCPVRIECMEYALKYRLEGCWGSSENQRREILNRRRREERQRAADTLGRM